MPHRIKVGLITSAAGPHLGAYFSALAAIEEVESVALVDPSNASIEAAKTALGDKLVGVYQQTDKMLQTFQPTLALASMEAVLAPAAIRQSLEQGCHVFAEKPACVRTEDFAPLIRLADSKHLFLMLALANRLNPEIQTARRLIQSGEIGKIYGVELHLIEDQTRLAQPAYQKSWFAQKTRAGGGHLSWLGIHWLDLAAYLTDAKIEQVAGFTTNIGGQPIDIEDSAVATLRFDNGALGTLTSGYYLKRGYQSHIKIWGADGWMELSASDGASLRWVSHKGEHGGEVQTFQGPRTPRGYTPFVQAAVRAAARLQEPPITNAESLHAIATVFAIYDAAATGVAQKVSA